MIRASLVAATLVACAPAAPRRLAPPRLAAPAVAAADAGSDVTAAPPGEEVPSLDALAERGPTDMPLMREVRRIEGAATQPSALEAKADACFRAALGASSPVRAWFEDERHVPRGEVARGAGLVPPRGPACARKGETLRLIVEPETKTAIARAVVWQAP